MLKIVLLVLMVVIVIFVAPRLFSGARVTPPRAGDVAPDFTLPSQEGAAVSLKDFRGKWVVLYFYPKDQTPGCTREAHNFQVDQPKYDQRNSVILDVIVVLYHQHFADIVRMVQEYDVMRSNLVVRDIAVGLSQMLKENDRICGSKLAEGKP